MPSGYAHKRFGEEILPQLPADLRTPLTRMKQMFLVGLHGPDLFFYYLPMFPNPIRHLGNTYHNKSGAAFFTAAAHTLELHPSQAGQAYLYGVLAHYALDSVCHPFINEKVKEGKVTHTQLEVEFDRFLLTLDGKVAPHFQNLGEHLRLTRGECETVALFYPPASSGDVSLSISTMAAAHKLFASHKRKLAATLLKLGGKTASQMQMPRQPHRDCAELDEDLLALYQQAIPRYLTLASQLQALLRDHTPLGPEFDPEFG